MVDDITTIKVKRDTKERLDKLGAKGESYDDILVRLLNSCEESLL